MEKKSFIIKSARETEDAGLNFAKSLKIGDVVLLIGALGAGKTTFVQGIAKGLLVKSRVISPSFVLLRRHRGKKDNQNINIYHIDLYRLESSDEIKNLGLEDIFEDTTGICLIEWGEKHESLKSDWKVKFETLNENERKIKIIKNENE